MVVVTVLVATVLAVFGADRSAKALSAADWDPGHIISDSVFFNASTMNESQVQAFLNAQVPNCVAANGYPCLKNYSVSTWSRPSAGPGHCAAYTGAENEPAARIIVKVAQACGINPQVLLVTLQKERSLITDTSPTAGDYQVSMGYGCPDTAPCNAEFYGFYNQVYKAAWQFRQYTNFPDRRFKIGPVSIGFHPNTACGATTVSIRNQATANLYNYTPYQPNAAALANLNGSGNSCSSYGNRNFWVFFHNWFGSPTGAGNPFGNVELYEAKPGTVRVAGWALDPNTTASIAVHVYVGTAGFAFTAAGNRPDVGAAYPANGGAHGFDATIKVPTSGTQDVCVYGINVGQGVNALIGCKRMLLMGGSPLGAVDTMVAGVGSVKVTGWTLDPDITGPIPVHIYVDGVGVAYQANKARAGLAATYPGYGDNHGFSETIPVAPGDHRICVYGINTGPGAHVELACRTVSIVGEKGRSPFGNFETAVGDAQGVSVGGWALDPDTVPPIAVHVYVDGVGYAIRADQTRTDVGRVYPVHGNQHGFAASIPAASGARNVCAFAINSGPGPHTLLGCRSVVVPNAIREQGRSPIGRVESVSASGSGITVSGWALDQDTVNSIPIHVYVDGVGVALTADESRPDVGRAYPGYGDAHGFAETLSATAGRHRVCVFAINTGPGPHTLLSCWDVTVGQSAPVEAGRSPLGNFEAATAAGGSISISGWALDPDTASSIQVHVYVDGVGAAYAADTPRADVGRAYPGLGDAHGFVESFAASPGRHTVCVYGINTGPGPHTLLGCRAVAS
ncbi:hypothetical protein [Agromyces albus]|uniref:hypothetical protein n=1 Tax=Agromyces albus TaxID=205332 RepID=UPI0027841E87|nr:hypothetical protein [Agromyces albus]MDQ0574690.1 hypothetical protein [Agromyces albus]